MLHVRVEVLRGGGWRRANINVGRHLGDPVMPFEGRGYNVWGFLANERNTSLSPLAATDTPRGLPADLSPGVAAEYNDYAYEAHGEGWLTAADLAAIDYAQAFEDRRNYAYTPAQKLQPATVAAGAGTQTTLGAFLGADFRGDLQALATLGPVAQTRVVFWFDAAGAI